MTTPKVFAAMWATWALLIALVLHFALAQFAFEGTLNVAFVTAFAAFVGGAMLALCCLPILIVLGIRHHVEPVPSDWVPPTEIPQYAYRDQSKVVPLTMCKPEEYPLSAYLDPGWQNRYRYISDAEIGDQVRIMCSEAVVNWHDRWPGVNKPDWFTDIDQQAETFLRDLQTAQFVKRADVPQPTPQPPQGRDLLGAGVVIGAIALGGYKPLYKTLKGR